MGIELKKDGERPVWDEDACLSKVNLRNTMQAAHDTLVESARKFRLIGDQSQACLCELDVDRLSEILSIFII